MTKKQDRKEMSLVLLGLAIGIIGGIILGFILQQMLITSYAVEVGESLEGSELNIEVNLNETVLVNKLAEVFVPLFNETLQEGEKLT